MPILVDAPVAANNITSAAVQHYTGRAPTYDASNSGWHIDLGHDYVKWLLPLLKPDDCYYVLDLACGTSLVTIPLAEAIGARSRTCKVIGVDATPAMLDEAKKKTQGSETDIAWLEADITSSSDVEKFKGISDIIAVDGPMAQGRGRGFDVISCCSALVLLSDPAEALKKWTSYLRDDGLLIADTPTEHASLLRLFTQELRLEAGLRRDFDWSWITSRHSVEELFQNAGLDIIQARVRHAGCGTPRVWRSEEWEDVFESELAKHADFLRLDESRKQQVKRAFKQFWDDMVKRDSEGKFRDQPRIYVVIARKNNDKA